jgi:hypothetical protein
VTIIGNSSGVNPTANANANVRAVHTLCVIDVLRTNTNTVMISVVQSNKILTACIPLSKLVFGRRLVIDRAICPKKVLEPIFRTTAWALPEETDVPIKHKLLDSNAV